MYFIQRVVPFIVERSYSRRSRSSCPPYITTHLNPRVPRATRRGAESLSSMPMALLLPPIRITTTATTATTRRRRPAPRRTPAMFLPMPSTTILILLALLLVFTFLLERIFGDGPRDRAAHGAQESVVDFMPCEGAHRAAGQCAHQAAVL